MKIELTEVDSDLMLLAIQEELGLLDGDSRLDPKEKVFALIKIHDGYNVCDVAEMISRKRWR